MMVQAPGSYEGHPHDLGDKTWRHDLKSLMSVQTNLFPRFFFFFFLKPHLAPALFLLFTWIFALFLLSKLLKPMHWYLETGSKQLHGGCIIIRTCPL
jgi:hypothetical protein